MAMHDLEDLHASFLTQSCFFYLSQCPVQRVEWVNETLSKHEQLASVPREIGWWRVLNKCPRTVSKCSCGLNKSLSIGAETYMTCCLGARPVLWTASHLWRDRTWTDDQYSIAAVWTWFHKIHQHNLHGPWPWSQHHLGRLFVQSFAQVYKGDSSIVNSDWSPVVSYLLIHHVVSLVSCDTLDRFTDWLLLSTSYWPTLLLVWSYTYCLQLVRTLEYWNKLLQSRLVPLVVWVTRKLTLATPDGRLSALIVISE